MHRTQSAHTASEPPSWWRSLVGREPVNDSHFSRLCAMGYPASRVKKILRQQNNHLQRTRAMLEHEVHEERGESWHERCEVCVMRRQRRDEMLSENRQRDERNGSATQYGTMGDALLGAGMYNTDKPGSVAMSPPVYTGGSAPSANIGAYQGAYTSAYSGPYVGAYGGAYVGGYGSQAGVTTGTGGHGASSAGLNSNH